MMSLGSSIWPALLIFIISPLQFMNCGNNNSPGETFPRELEIEINSNANITCRMNPSKFGGNLNSSSLFFEQEDTKYVVPNDNIDIINDTTIVYMLRNAPEQDRYYICKINTKNNGPKGIDTTRVSVGTAPQNITDFKCRGYNYMYMVCNFTRPHNLLQTKYSLSYTALSPNYIQTCHLEIQDDQAICNLTKDENNYRQNYEFYNFTLKSQNEVGVNVQSFLINHYESVIPPRPEYSLEKITVNSIVLKWYNPKFSFYITKGLEYNVSLRVEGSAWQNASYSVIHNQSEYKLIVTHLPFPYIWYEIRVRLRVKKSFHDDDSYWSEPYLEKFQTSACPPHMPPKTDVGSFYIDSSETKVRIYWVQLPHYHENGPDFKYIIKEVKRDGVKVSLKPLHIDRNSATFIWDRNHNYTFAIKSSNVEGESPASSTIFVPAWPEHYKYYIPQGIRNIYHANNSTYTLSWIPPQNVPGDDFINYTVFWCQSKHATTTECEGRIYFREVDKNSTQYNTLPQKQDKIFNMAVSANYRHINTGMHWVMCPADLTSELIKLEPEITDIKNRSITVQWSTDSVCSSHVEGYSLIYCRIARQAPTQVIQQGEDSTDSCIEDPIKLKISHTAKRYTMENLKPYSSYKIQMNMFSKLAPGNLSDPQIVNTHEDAPSKPHNLRAYNVTSNSVVLTWSQPKHHNGLLRKYRISYNNEHHTINCNDGDRCAPKQMEYKLENLSSYTSYKIYIIAHTTAPSHHSNDITIKTLVGIPSNPRNVKTENKTMLQWSRPEVPSGRVEFYEVCITLWYKDQIHRRHISGIIDANECKYNLPVCIDSDYRFTIEVRAVNVVRRDTEIDHEIFTTKNVSSDDVSTYYVDNYDLRCVGTALSEEEQLTTIHKYQDVHKYVQYMSVWEKGPGTNCSDTELGRISVVALIIVISSLGVMAAFYVARNKYQKMANISCALPPGLEAIPYPIKVDGGDDFRRSKDPYYNNESRRLLSSISHDSGYACHNGEHNNVGLNGITSCSLGKSSGYIGSNHSTEYCTQETLVASDNVSEDSCVIDQTPVVDDAYMVMELLKPNDNKLSASSSTTTFDNIISQSDSNGNGYVQPSFTSISALSGNKNTAPPMAATKLPTSFMPTDNGYIKQIPSSMHTQILPSENGYIKPNNLFNWTMEKMPQHTTMSQTTGDPNTMAGLPISDSGYVAPQLFQMPPTSADGYTSLEALGKSLKSTQPTMSQTFINPGEGGGGGVHSTNLPPISGYVTQKELSAFGQQQKLN